MRSRVLFVTGHSEDARQLSHMLESLPVAIDHAGNLRQARTQLRRQHYDVVLTEAALPDGNWLDALHLARECPACLEVIVTDPQADAQLWAEALNLGAYDLIAQPFCKPEVQRILYNACTRTAYRARGSAAH
jgi:DNA-binding NtrC family response regulator